MSDFNLNVIILANRQQIDTAGHLDDYPIYLSQRNGVSVLEKLIDSCTLLQSSNIVFSAFERDISKYNLKQVLNRLAPDIRISVTPNLTKGSACTALLTACAEPQDAELLILSANELIDVDLLSVISYFRSMKSDAGVITFKSIHPRYSYVKIEDTVKVTEFAQKEQISEFATTGLFWFRETKECVESLMDLIRNRSPIANSYYVGSALNEIILKGKKVVHLQLKEGLYHPLKDASQVRFYESGGYDETI